MRWLFALLFCIVLYLSVKPSPAIQEVRWIPAEAALFFDLHDGWKNALGFGTLALAGFLGWPQGWGPASWSRSRKRLSQMILCCGIAIGMELLQLLIPSRFCDIKDIAAGSFGVALAWLVAGMGERCVRITRPNLSKPQKP